ncbi:MAG: NEAT domain-containing protein [Maledivibacter sp.]|jgi:Mn-dependent DtxR family transcriptional regulator|nr:NEAT domain-containing protein [Maledivibacter sp.]
MVYELINKRGELEEMNLTPKQLQYLFYIDFYRKSNRLISDLAERLGVSKAAVSQVIDIYGTNGLINRDSSGKIVLTHDSELVIKEIKRKHEIIFTFFSAMRNFTDEMAIKSALQYICFMPCESVDGLIQKIKENDEMSRIRWDLNDKKNRIDFPFNNGSYQVNFNVYKKGCQEISMGDKGFVKPAKMVVIDGTGTITLTAKEIRYKGERGKNFRGRLSRLSCLMDDDYVQIKRQKNEYTIPLHYINKLSKAPDGTLFGTVRILAQAGKCVANMSASEADMVFKFV